MKIIAFTAAVLVGSCLGHEALAGPTVLFNDGPTTAEEAGWLISGSDTVAASFTLSQAATVSEVDFDIDIIPHDTLSTVDWSIMSAATGGTMYGSGTASPTSGSSFVSYQNTDVIDESFGTGTISLAAGTYWLKLDGAVDADRQGVAWFEAGTGSLVSVGPSITELNGDGVKANAHEEFQILGTSSSSTVPEPASAALLAGGVLGLGWFRRRR